MKKSIVFAVALVSLTVAAQHFLTPSMVKRNGLTDEQYELLWSMGKRPQIEPAAAKDWIFRASRYENVKDWLGEIGKTNDFARLAARVPALTETNSFLVATNSVLVRLNDRLQERYEWAYDGWTNSYAIATNYYSKYSIATNDLRTAIEAHNSAEARAESAEARRREIVSWAEEQRDKAVTSAVKKLWQIIIDKLNSDTSE